MLTYLEVKLSNRLGQRGAEMVEYAIVLACICAVGVMFYATRKQGASGGLDDVLTTLWNKIADSSTQLTPKN